MTTENTTTLEDDGLVHDDSTSGGGSSGLDGDPESQDGGGTIAEAGLMTLTEHLEELRLRLIVSLIAFGVATCGTVIYANPLMKIVLATKGTATIQFIALTPGETFFTEIKVALLSAFILSLPVMVWQAWLFVKPGLKTKERAVAKLFIPLATLMFALGSVFAYFIVIPFGVAFLAGVGTDLAMPQYSITNYTEFVLFMILALGLSFETPLVLVLLGKLGLVTSAWLARQRKHIILVIFIFAAVITPTPDMVTQCLLAVPLCLLFEGTVITMKLLKL